jgi:hypothetical protein
MTYSGVACGTFSMDKFRPIIQEDGRVVAGGMTIANISDDGTLVFEDRWRQRQVARGTPDVPVDLAELIDAVIVYLIALDRGLGL